MWYGNYAEPKEAQAKVKGKGESVRYKKKYTARDVSGKLFAHKIKQVAKGAGEGIEKYGPASKLVIQNLTAAERAQLSKAVDEWNTNGPPGMDKAK